MGQNISRLTSTKWIAAHVNPKKDGVGKTTRRTLFCPIDPFFGIGAGLLIPLNSSMYMTVILYSFIIKYAEY